MAVKPAIRVNWEATLRSNLAKSGFSVFISKEHHGVQYTAGLSLSGCHPELCFQHVDADVAKYMIDTVRGIHPTAMKAEYRPGIHEILGREITISEIPRNAISKWLPVAWRLINQDIRALRVQSSPALAGAATPVT